MTYYKNLFYVILLVILFFSCKTSSAMETLDANDTRLIFGSSTDSTPYARTWDNSALSWGSVTSTLTASATIKWTVHKIGLSNAEELVGVLADVGATDKLVMLRYADPSWSADWVADSVPDAGKREFDIEYEAASGDALVVYSNNTTNPEYRTRSGGSWSATSSVFSTPPGSGSVQWIKLAQRPSSNEIALVYSDANSDLFTVIWDGSSWTESTTETTLETNLAQITTDVFDVEYEQTSGDLMVVWAPTANIYYGLKLVSSNTFTTGTVLTATTPTFVDLAAQPDGRRMAVGYLSNSDDMRTSLWDGDAWVNGLTVDSTAGSPGAGDAMAQVGWVGDTDTVVIIYYDTSDGAGSRLHWLKATSTGTFVQQTDVTGITGCANATQQSYVVESFTTLDKLMVIMSDGSNDICALTYNGSSWTVTNSGTALGTELSSSSSVPFSLGMSQTLPSLNFSSATSTNSEASTTVTFSIDISTTTERVTTFYYSIAASSTATGSGTDYTLANGTTSIISGSSTTSISVTITDDSLDENDETIVIQLSSSTNATLGTTTQHVYTITDNDSAPTIQFSLATSTGSESTATGTLEIALSASSSFTITVQYTVQSSSTATGSGTDYTLANGTSTISAGNTTTSISITIVNDAVDEVDETIVLQLSTSTNATLGTTTQHIYTTTDDDDAPTLSFISSTSSYSEGSATATLILQLSATSSQSITIQYRALSTSTATGSGSDFTLANGTSTISAGNSTTSIQVTLIDDSLDEDSELIYVNIHTPTNATVGSTSTHTLTLTDNDDPPTIYFASSSSSYTESAVNATLILSLSATSSLSITVQYRALSTSTATGSGTDFTLSDGTSTISAGNSTTSISVTLIDDSSDESDEIIYLNIHTSSNATLGSTSTHTLTLTDNDEPASGGSSSGGGGGGVPSYTLAKVLGLKAPQVIPPSTPSLANTPTERGVIQSFSRSLESGMTGPDVKQLQVFLNQNGFIISESGPGSPGNETDKFGSLTKNALIKFQEKYRDEILTPSGLSKGTGYVGPKTIAFLNTFKPNPEKPKETLAPTIIVEKPKTEKPKSKEVSTASFQRSLKLGMEGNDVKLLQEVLSKNPNIYPEGVISGYFGPLTEEAVKRFQLVHKITTKDDIALGFVGPKTRTLLNVLVEGE